MADACRAVQVGAERRLAVRSGRYEVEPPAWPEDVGEQAGHDVAAFVLEGERRHGDEDVIGEHRHESAEVGGNCEIQGNGRQASTITFECEVMPRALSAAGMRGSSVELQALRMMSSCSDGSQRVATAHITSLRLEGSTSSSTTTTMRAM